MLKDTSGAKWRFTPSDLALEDATVFCFADSSFANVERQKSQCGYVIGLTKKEILDGGEVPIYIVETYSGSIKRVGRSTLAAESNGFLTGVESAEYLRSLILELLHPGVLLRDLDAHYRKGKLVCVTDAKSLEATLNRDTGAPQDKRVRILVAQIREMIGENNFEDEAESAFAHWCDTSQMLADVLTKIGCERAPLLQALHSGRWQLEPSEEALLKKMSIRAGRHARKALARSKDG